MSEAVFEYRCRRCGKVVDGDACSKEQAETIFTILLPGGGLDPRLQTQILHPDCYCDETGTTGVGVTDLIGYRIIEEIHERATETHS